MKTKLEFLNAQGNEGLASEIDAYDGCNPQSKRRLFLRLAPAVTVQRSNQLN
jgi:hypothetical protein